MGAESEIRNIWSWNVIRQNNASKLGCPNESAVFQGSERTADYSKLLEYGLDSKVADKLDDIYKVQKWNHLKYIMGEDFLGVNKAFVL